MKDFILDAPETTSGVAICDGTRDAKVSFKATNGQQYTYLCRTDWLRYCEGRIPVRVQYSMQQDRKPSIWTVMSRLD